MAAFAIFCLGGCAQLGQITAQDAETAGKVAAAVGDTAGEQCWPVLATTGNAIAATGNSTGILTLIEEKRAFKAALETPTCQPVWAGVLAEVLKLTPVAPLVP